MGLDAEIVAVKSKKRFYIDREYNISNFQVHAETDQQLTWEIYRAAQDLNGGVSKAQMAVLALAARRSWELEGPDGHQNPEGRVALMDKLLEMIRQCPDDEYFILLPDNDWNGHLRFKSFEWFDLCT